MERSRIRDLLTLTNDEIIGLVDLLVSASRLHNDDAEYGECGDSHYRKIEAKIMPGSRNIIIRVTYAECIDDPPHVVAFILDDADWDVIIVPVIHHKFSAEFVNSVGVNYDFTVFENGVKEQYMYFAENLQLWNLSNIAMAENPDLKDDWNTIDVKLVI